MATRALQMLTAYVGLPNTNNSKEAKGFKRKRASVSTGLSFGFDALILSPDCNIVI